MSLPTEPLQTATTASSIEKLARELTALPGVTAGGNERPATAGALAESVQRVVALESFGAQALRVALRQETGLSTAMVEWGLRSLGESFEEAEVVRLAAGTKARSGMLVTAPRLTVVVLSGNVFTAGIRAVALSLLAGGPTLLKLKGGTGALVRRWLECLKEVDAKLASRIGVVEFERTSDTCFAALLKHADVVSAYGSDETMRALRQRVPPTARLIEHGHGLSVAYVPGAAITDQVQLDGLAARLALDVAAYDQLGCLSPQAVLVESGGWAGHEEVALALHGALMALESRLPRGEVAADQAAAIVQWQGVAAACGRLHRSQKHACSAEAGALRSSPGCRQIGVYRCTDTAELAQRLAPLGSHVKAVGVAGRPSCRLEVGRALPPGLAPRICPVGEMQTPPLAACFDGQLPFFGMLNYIEVD